MDGEDVFTGSNPLLIGKLISTQRDPGHGRDSATVAIPYSSGSSFPLYQRLWELGRWQGSSNPLLIGKLISTDSDLVQWQPGDGGSNPLLIGKLISTNLIGITDVEAVK